MTMRLQLAGPLLALAVHTWTESRQKKADRQSDRELKYYRSHARALSHRIDAQNLEIERLHGLQSPSVVPPFPPGEACSDFRNGAETVD